MLKQGEAVLTPKGDNMFKAIETKQMKPIELLIKQGYDLEVRDQTGRSALILAAECGELEVVKLLIASGSIIEAQEQDGYTALMVAATKGYKDIVALLLEHGANPNVQSN